MKIVMSEIEADAFCDAMHAYMQAVVADATADAGDSQSGFAESHARKAFVAFLTGAFVASPGNRGADDHEREIIERALRSEQDHRRATDALETHFMPLVRAALQRGDIDGARAIQRRIPGDSVTYVFAMDAIRQATKGSSR